MPDVKLSKAWHKDGHYFVVPSDSFPVQVVGLGQTIDAAIDLCHFMFTKLKEKI